LVGAGLILLLGSLRLSELKMSGSEHAMPLLTFDSSFGDDSKAELAQLLGGREYPDLIEIGENNDVWFKVRRSTKKLMLISKQTGAVVVRCDISDKVGLSLCGLTKQQNGWLYAALKLGGKP
jgi:hypothetical protein